MPDHNSLTDPELHEPKGASSAVSGAVYVADGSGSGTWGKYAWSNIQSKVQALTLELTDVSTAGQTYVVSPYTGTIQTVYSVLNGAISGADAALTVKINGTEVTDGGITLAQSGSAAGDVDSSTPTAANAVTPGDVIEVETDGASTGAVKAVITVVLAVV